MYNTFACRLLQGQALALRIPEVSLYLLNLPMSFSHQRFHHRRHRTTTIRKMENLKKKQYTTVEFSNIEYNIGAKEEIFTERYLKNPPRKYIK